VPGVGISASDWVEGAWDVEQSAVFAQQRKALGYDFIHVSSGGVSPQQKMAPGSNYLVPFAKRIREA
jgi:2,4-dienoyl-CoA reductase-like NADH-dependent reductase (Old Yellow Enzyme family)